MRTYLDAIHSVSPTFQGDVIYVATLRNKETPSRRPLRAPYSEVDIIGGNYRV